MQRQRTRVHSQTVVLRNALGQSVLFGMHWSAVIGSQAMKLARKRARLLRATHFLVAGAPASTVGCAQLAKHHHNSSEPTYSAAALFAATFPIAAVASLVAFEDGRCWMVAAHSGSILSQTDQWFENLSEAQEALSEIRLRFPNLQVHQVCTASATALPEWLNERCPEQTRLLINRVSRVNASVGWGMVLAVAVTGAWTYWRPETPVFDATVVQDHSAQRWLEVMNHYALQHPVHGFSDLMRVMADWRRVPFDPSGWKLLKIQCEPLLFEWSCAAQYRREHRLALNQHLESAKPLGWTLHPIALDQASLTWTIPQAAQALSLAQSQPPFDWMTTLQSVSPLFEHIQLGVPAKLRLSSPLSAQGQPIAEPEGMPRWEKRSLALKGPMRSLSALQGLQMPVRWRSATLEVGAISGQALARSALVVQLIGEMFEQKKESTE